MWRTTLCPTFTFKSFTFVNVLLQVILFFVALIISATEKSGLSDKVFLGLDGHNLTDFGMRMPAKIVNEVALWRCLSSLYLPHALLPLVLNSLAQCILGFALEQVLGPLRMAILYFFTGVSANLFAVACSELNATGPAPAIFGVLGGIIGIYVYYWPFIFLPLWRKAAGCLILVFLAVLGLLF